MDADSFDVTARKERAAARFLELLLRTAPGRRVARAVLFGSVAEGRARPQSDVDILLFGTGSLSDLSAAAADAAFEVALEMGESVEPLVYCTDDLAYPSGFIIQAMRYGKELYAMDEQQFRRDEAEVLLDLAREYRSSAQHAADAGFFRMAVDAAYNSAELAVKALILLAGASRPTSHGGAVQTFGRLYVQTGRASRELARRLGIGLELHNKARYDGHARIRYDDAQDVIRLAGDLIALAEEELAQQPAGPEYAAEHPDAETRFPQEE